MATSNWHLAASFQSTYPHTFNAMQKLVMVMADYHKNRGKKTFFGRDKGLATYKKFEDVLRDTLLSMVMDGVIRHNSEPTECREQLIEAVNSFAAVFPNWQDAYVFASEYLVDQSSIAEDRIRDLMRQ